MNQQNQKTTFSLNASANRLVERLIANADSLRIAVHTLENGARVIDAGIKVPGGLEAGRQIAEICMGGLGNVRLRCADTQLTWPWHIDVHSASPVMACLASQYAGWSLAHGEGKSAFYALGSGPARAIGSKEPLFEELGYRDRADAACLVLEVDKIPPLELVQGIADKCQIPAECLTLILTPTSSLSGAVQIVARVLETALHKAHALHFPLEGIIDGMGSAPVAPPGRDFLTAMSRTNDAILFAGQVHLFVDADDKEAEELADKLPSSASADYGKPFGQVFKDVNYDFYKVDPMLFSPARVTVSSIRTGRSFQAGRIDHALLEQSFSGSFSSQGS